RRAIVRRIVCATDRDASQGHLLDRGIEYVRRRHIDEPLLSRWRRIDNAKRSNYEGGHLLARHWLRRAEISSSAALRYPKHGHLFDEGIENIRRRNIRKSLLSGLRRVVYRKRSG